MDKPHDLHAFIRNSQDDLQREYTRIQSRATEDPGTAGDQGEENWATLLRSWLPQNFYVVTKGRILTQDGYVSPQVDVLVLSPSYPRILIDKKLYLSGGVVAAFECKITLTAKHVLRTVQTAAEIKAALPKTDGTPYRELHTPFVFGLLAHAHSWTSAGSKAVENIEKALWKADSHFTKHPRECIDLITVSDLATWTSMKTTFIGPGTFGKYSEVGLEKIYGPNGSATSGYLCSAVGIDIDDKNQQSKDFSPVGAMLSTLFTKLAWQFSEMRPLSDYFFAANVGGVGMGRMRNWESDIYSDYVRARVGIGDMNYTIGIFDEWSVSFG
ncbi:MAG TPA: DUF6602 domain-containing protein [Pyrinomonadaceae bacterium]|jgi:hypothetical protein|nr:DUF6602 domain-containing protein [Pyrinomonadaceae bacterium]